jgi:hypothetical protein
MLNVQARGADGIRSGHWSENPSVLDVARAPGEQKVAKDAKLSEYRHKIHYTSYFEPA